MAHASRIEWTETTWNPVAGCTKVSAGCSHCYAERMANRLAAMARSDLVTGRSPGRKANYLTVVNGNGHWSGKLHMDESALDTPRTWKSGRLVFVNSMSDLFHDEVDESFIRAVFRIMADCPQHRFQVLTKRPWRAAELAAKLEWPQNIWFGTSVENSVVTHRIADLRRIPAKTRFLSLEPLLGPIQRLPLKGIHWVIVGGESGPGSRPLHIDWVRQLRDRCVARDVPFFFKQWGGVNKKRAGRELDGKRWDEMPPLSTSTCNAEEKESESVESTWRKRAG